MSDISHEIDFLIIIAGRKMKSRLLDAVSECGGRMMEIVYGKGSVKASYLQDAFGLVPEENKVVITCLASRKRSDKIMNMLTNEFDFDMPNTGIAFTIPVEKLSF